MSSGRELNICETYFHWLVWVGAVVYSIYQVHLANSYFDDFYDAYTDFAPGWSWLGRKQDISDFEWRTWIPLIIRLIPWLLVHHVVGGVIKISFDTTTLCCWYIAVSTTLLYYYFGLASALCVLAQPLLLHRLIYTNKVLIWTVHVTLLFVVHFLKVPNGAFQNWMQLGDEDHYVLTLVICWIQLRSISQCIEVVESSAWRERSIRVEHFLERLAYCLYLPTLFLGPLILYDEFSNAVNKAYPVRSWSLGRVREHLIDLIRYTFWLCFTELCLHFVYFNALQFHPEVVRNLNSWALYGLGYCMGQFFLNKYVVVYGISCTLCRIDGIPSPPQPKCIGRIHLYSDMWKHFDRGLYKFLIRYIYVPLSNLNLCCGKLFASLVCFAFVFMWHGVQTNILIWASLNYIGLTIEEIVKFLGKSRIYELAKKRYLGTRGAARFECALASPLLAMSAVSNFYFFAGQDVGIIFVERISNESWKALLVLFFSLYCCCHVSVSVKMCEVRRSMSKQRSNVA